MPLPYPIVVLANMARRKLLRHTDFNWVESDQVDTILPLQATKRRPAISLEGQFDKVISSVFNSDERNFTPLRGGAVMYGKLLKLTLNNVYVTSKYLYWGGGERKIFGNTLPNPPLRQEFETVESGALASSYWGTNYFGHWLRDDCATYEMARDYGDVFAMPTPDWSDRTPYQTAFGQTWTPAEGKLFQTLHLFYDIDQNHLKAARTRSLRARLRDMIKGRGKDIVFIKRGKGGASRALTNQDEIVALLEAEGVAIVEAESDWHTLVPTVLDARVVISVEGSQLSHCVYGLRDDGGLLVIQPPRRFFISHFEWSAGLDMRFAFVVGDPDPVDHDAFSVDPDDLLRTLDLLLKALDQPANP